MTAMSREHRFPKDRVTVDVERCARCGNDHKALGFHRRPKPIQIGNLLFSFWALCPATNEVINLRISETEATQP